LVAVEEVWEGEIAWTDTAAERVEILQGDNRLEYDRSHAAKERETTRREG